MRLDSRAALTCLEFLHKKFAPSLFDLSKRKEVLGLAKEIKEQGILHEANVLTYLKEHYPEMTILDKNLSDEDLQIATAAALLDGTSRIIYNAFIAETCEQEVSKATGHAIKTQTNRASKPDLLIRIGTDARGVPQWAPVDIKSHGAFDESKTQSVYISDSTDLHPDKGIAQPGRLKEDDAIQIAHYVRHLELLGLMNENNWVGIIGRESAKCAWSQINTIQFGVGKTARTALGIYDLNFAKALEIAENSYAQNTDHSIQVDVVAEVNNDPKFGCKACELRYVCQDEMYSYDNNEGHVTLLATVTQKKRDDNFPSISSIRELREATPANPFMAEAQIRANVWKSRKPVLLNPTEPLVIPEFDIEIDIDLENSQAAISEEFPGEEFGVDRLYLYGFGVLDRTASKDWRKAEIGTFSNYDDNDLGELQVFLSMWNLLQEQIRGAESLGRTVGIFHYSQHENSWWRKLATRFAGQPGVPDLTTINTFIANYMHDLYALTTRISFPTMDYSVKTIAKLAGFEWSVDAAGGDTSIVKYREAISKDQPDVVREAAIKWLDDYNRDDVRATFAVREYLRNLTL